jgi:hypothetical protein
MAPGRVRYERGWAWRIVHLALGATLDAAVALATGEPTVVKLADRDEDGLVRSIRAVRRIMAAEGTPVGRYYVSSCLKRYFKRGDPWVTNDRWRRCGKRATRRQRVWMKNRLRRDPTMYFDELSKEMHAKFGRSISDCMISSALKHDGGCAEDRPLSLKALTVLAAQRNEALRTECFYGLAGIDTNCLIIIDESHIADRDGQRRRGWAPRGEPAYVYEMFGQDGTLRSLLAAVNKNGFVLPACQLVEGGVGDDEFWSWACLYLFPVLNPYDEHELPNRRVCVLPPVPPLFI